MGIWIARDKITLIQGDGVMTDYERMGAFRKRDSKYDSVWMCREGFDERDVDWSGFPTLVERHSPDWVGAAPIRPPVMPGTYESCVPRRPCQP